MKKSGTMTEVFRGVRGASDRPEGGGSVKAAFSSTSREFTSRYAGLSFYWAWVFLSFNSLDIVGGDGRAISIVHIMSSATAMVMFAVCGLIEFS